MFITRLVPVTTVEDALNEVEISRGEFPDARHTAWALLLDNDDALYEDDGEPDRTAGIPMLEVLKRRAVTNILAVTVRYLGSQLLGRVELVVAYSRGVSTALDRAELAPVGAQAETAEQPEQPV
jgi:putative IMPACT (imprinted ancient) family translation regulator